MVPSLHPANETKPFKCKLRNCPFFKLKSKLDFQPVMTEKMLGYLQAFFSSSRSLWWCFTTLFSSFCGQPKCQLACRNSFSWLLKCSMHGALVARYCRFDYWFPFPNFPWFSSDRWHTNVTKSWWPKHFMHVTSFLHGSLNTRDFHGLQLRWHSSMTIWYVWFCGFCPWPTMGARSGLDVFCVTILAGVLEIKQFADFIVGNKCVQTPVPLNLIEWYSFLVDMENPWSEVGIGRAPPAIHCCQL